VTVTVSATCATFRLKVRLTFSPVTTFTSRATVLKPGSDTVSL
jgi:hypothetical protein